MAVHIDIHGEDDVPLENADEQDEDDVEDQPGEDAALLGNADEQDGNGTCQIFAILGRFIIRVWYSLMGQYFPRIKFGNTWKSKFLSFLFVLKFICFSSIICVI